MSFSCRRYPLHASLLKFHKLEFVSNQRLSVHKLESAASSYSSPVNAPYQDTNVSSYPANCSVQPSSLFLRDVVLSHTRSSSSRSMRCFSVGGAAIISQLPAVLINQLLRWSSSRMECTDES